MAKERNKTKKDVPELTIFEERKLSRASATEVLKIAQKQEQKKIKEGYRYVSSSDGKTMTLTKMKK